MPVTRIIAVACLTLLGAAFATPSGVARSDETPAKAAAPAVHCEEAIVSPVSGDAQCVRPMGAPVDPPPPRPRRVTPAAFDFELEDVTPAASFLGQTTSGADVMDKVSDEARRMLAASGDFVLVDVSHVDAEPVRAHTLRRCDGCQARIARELGADEALVGVVRRVTQTDYYVVVQFSDAETGKVIDQQEANFAGGPDGWASGVRMLLKHQVLEPLESR